MLKEDYIKIYESLKQNNENNFINDESSYDYNIIYCPFEIDWDHGLKSSDKIVPTSRMELNMFVKIHFCPCFEVTTENSMIMNNDIKCIEENKNSILASFIKTELIDLKLSHQGKCGCKHFSEISPYLIDDPIKTIELGEYCFDNNKMEVEDETTLYIDSYNILEKVHSNTFPRVKCQKEKGPFFNICHEKFETEVTGYFHRYNFERDTFIEDFVRVFNTYHQCAPHDIVAFYTIHPILVLAYINSLGDQDFTAIKDLNAKDSLKKLMIEYKNELELAIYECLKSEVDIGYDHNYNLEFKYILNIF